MSSENNSCTPKLRFPGFTGEWEEKKLGDIAKKKNKRNNILNVTRVLTNSANEGIVDQSSYFDRDIAVKDNTSNYHIVDTDDFVYNPRISTAAPVGPISINKVGLGIMSPLYTVFKFHSGNVSFLEHYFQTSIWHSYLKSIANFGARHDRMNITSEGFFNMPIFLPSLEEQEKIADCLSELDSLISAQGDKVDALKKHKKGLMQQLFPQPGESTPRLRFPEFSGEWEEKTLGSIAKKVNLRNSKMEITRVLTNSANSGIVDQNDYFDRSITVKENTANYHIVDINEFVYNPRISSAAPVGPISINKIGKGIMSPLYTIFRFHTGCVAFYEQYFQTTIWHPYLKSIANFGARFDRMNITSEGFFNMPLYIPSYTEQQNIAEFLSNFESLISDEETKLQSLKDHKKGLMQQLFPTPSK